MKWIKNIVAGAVIGVANIIPGVSGGTMAVLLNIYEELIGSVSHFWKNMKQSLRLLIPVGIGAVAGILLFSNLLKYLLAHFPMATNYFFIGLICGSIPMIFKRATEGGVRPKSVIPFLLALAFMAIISYFSAQSGTATLITTLTPSIFAKLVFFSAIAAMAMILPGVSGSMMLVIFGVYNSVLTAISELNVILLIPVAIGVIIGILGGAKLIDICLHKFPQATFCAILGLIIGSLYSLFYNAGFVLGWELAVSILVLLLGAAISLFFASDWFAGRMASLKKG
jgi:putative membrane protein